MTARTVATVLSGAALAAAMTVGAAIPATAGGLDDIVQIEVIDGGMTARGTYQAALRLTLQDGWKTYWRAPGDNGIPPQIDWRGSRNLGEVSITWPTPKVFDQGGLRSIGYENQLVLPVEITPKNAGQPVTLGGEIEFGICKDVCVPGQLDFNRRLDAESGRSPAIAAALAQRPFSETEAGVRSSVCRLSPAANGALRIEARITMPSAGDDEIAVIEPGDPELWVSDSETRRQGDTLIASTTLEHMSGRAYAIDRGKVRITVLGNRHAVDIRGCAPG